MSCCLNVEQKPAAGGWSSATWAAFPQHFTNNVEPAHDDDATCPRGRCNEGSACRHLVLTSSEAPSLPVIAVTSSDSQLNLSPDPPFSRSPPRAGVWRSPARPDLVIDFSPDPVKPDSNFGELRDQLIARVIGRCGMTIRQSRKYSPCRFVMPRTPPSPASERRNQIATVPDDQERLKPQLWDHPSNLFRATSLKHSRYALSAASSHRFLNRCLES